MAINRTIEELGKGPLTEGDGHGLGNTLGPDVAAGDSSSLEAVRARKRGSGVAPDEAARSAADRRSAGSDPPDQENH